MSRLIDLTNKRSGKLTILYRVENDNNNNPKWFCRCDCGSTKIIYGSHLRSKETKSCGCLIGVKHGQIRNTAYTTWTAMKQRCYNVKAGEYKNYGGRGIKVCDEWLKSFATFLEDMGNKTSREHSIERIDNDGNYNKENCRWATWSEQALNKRMQKNNQLGIRGIHETKNGKYTANIFINRKSQHLGTFNNLEDAITVRQEAARKRIKKLEIELDKQ